MAGHPVDLGHITLQVSHAPGRSPTVVFIHGGLGSRLNWRSQWEFLHHQGQQVLAYDLAGHGQSSRYRRYSVGRHRRDLTRLLHHFKIHAPILCCHSYGVPIGLEWARRHAVSALIAIGGGTHDLTPWWEVPIVKFLGAGGHRLYEWHQQQPWFQKRSSQPVPASLDRFWQDNPLPTEAHPYEAMESFWGYDGRHHKLTCPLLIVTGAKDPMFPPWMGQNLAAHLGCSSSHLHYLNVANSGHLVMAEAPEIINQALLQVIQGCTSGLYHPR